MPFFIILLLSSVCTFAQTKDTTKKQPTLIDSIIAIQDSIMIVQMKTLQVVDAIHARQRLESYIIDAINANDNKRALELIDIWKRIYR